MSGPQPPRRRRIAGESKPGDAADAPQARKAVPPRTPARPVVPTPKPAPTRREREAEKRESKETKAREEKAAAAAPAVRRPVARPTRPVREPVDAGDTRRTPATETEPETETVEASASAARRRPGRAQVLPVLVLLIGIVAAGAGYWQMQRSAPLDRAEASAAADAAATAVEAVLSFDYRDLDAYETGVDGLLTDDYVSDELEPSLAALREQAPAAAAEVQATVHAASTETCRGECPADRASVLVLIDKVTLTSNLQTPTVTPQRLRVSLVDVDGRWLVDSIDYVGA